MFSKACIFLLSVAGSVSASWFAADVYTSPDSCTASGDIQVSVLKEIGVCMELPDGLPEPFSAVKSYKIGSCSESGDFVAVEFDAYMKSGCSGIKIPYKMDDKIPSGCVNNTRISCPSSHVSLTEKWPSAGVYLEDETCSNLGGMVNVRPDCASITSPVGDFSTAVSCATADEINIKVYNETLTCSDGVLSQDLSYPAGVCTLLGDIPIPTLYPTIRPFNAVESALTYPLYSVEDIVLTGYYKASCDGL